MEVLAPGVSERLALFAAVEDRLGLRFRDVAAAAAATTLADVAAVLAAEVEAIDAEVAGVSVV